MLDRKQNSGTNVVTRLQELLSLTSPIDKGSEDLLKLQLYETRREISKRVDRPQLQRIFNAIVKLIQVEVDLSDLKVLEISFRDATTTSDGVDGKSSGAMPAESFCGTLERVNDDTGKRKAEGGLRLSNAGRARKSKSPLVSIVTVVLNNITTLQRCIDSVRAQKYDNIEHIIVDGGSEAATLDILERNSDNIEYFVSEPDSGIYAAMNKGIRLARGEYVCLLNSDDCYDPDFIARSIEVANAGETVDIVYSDFFDGDAHLPARQLNDGILLGNLNINHGTFLVHRDCYNRVGPYREDLGIVSDMVWIRKAYQSREKFQLLSEPFFRFSHGGASSGNSPARRRKIIAENAECYRVYFPFLTQEEAEILYLLRFGDERLETAVDLVRRYGADHPQFRSAVARYVEHCFRDRDAFKLDYDQEERFRRYWSIASYLGIDHRHVRIVTSIGCLSKILGAVADMPLKKRAPGTKRILHYVTVFSAPSETFIFDLVQRLEEESHHDNIVLFQQAELRRERPFIKSVHIPWEKFRPSISQAIYEYIVATCEIDLLITHFAINEYRLHERIAPTGIKLPTIVMTHGIDVFLLKEPSSYTSYVLNDLAKRDDVYFTAVSSYLKSELTRSGVAAAKIHVLPNAVNKRFFHHRKKDGFFDRSRPLEFLSIGRLVPWKGHRFALDALAQFRDRCTEKFRWTIVYGEGDGELQALSAQAEELGLDKHIVFEPFVDFSKAPDYLAHFDLFIHPSTYSDDPTRKSETFGVAVLEAIAAGLPVVTTDAGGLPEVIGTAHAHANVVAHGDATALFGALARMYNSPETFSDNIAFALDRLNTFSSTRQLADLDALIRRILDPLKVAMFSSSTLQGAGYAAYRVHRGLSAMPGVKSHLFTTVNQHQKELGVRFITHPSGNGHRWRTLQPSPKPGMTIFSINDTHLRSEELLELVAYYDVINLHWHARFLSAENVATLTWSGKPVVMTIRDMQPITGGCHFFHGCEKWQTDCRECPQIPSAYVDYPSTVLDAKRAHYNFDNLTLVAISNHTRAILQRAPKFRDCRIETIPNSIETDVFRPYDRVEQRRALGLPLDRKIIGYVPSFSSEIKGYKEFLAALQILNLDNKGVDPFVLLVGNDTPATAAIRQDKKALGYISNNAKLAQAYSCADVIVVPSLEETFSNTTAEAISCGVPVVGFRTGAIPDMVLEGKTGKTCEVGDVAGLAAAIKQVLAGPDLSRACRLHAEETLSFMIQAHRYQELFTELASAARPKKTTVPRIFDCFDTLGFRLSTIAAEIAQKNSQE